MEPLTGTQSMDRHVLVTAIWLALGLVAAALFSYGFGAGGPLYVLVAVAAILAAFVGHVIVNAVYHTTFTARELALGLVAYATALVGFGIATLLSPEFADRNFLPLSIGFLAVFVSVVFYMVTHFGIRDVFDAFDVIRDFKPRDAEIKPAHRDAPR